MLNNKFKIECSNVALNLFAQLYLLVIALFLVEYKLSKRKRAVGDVFDAKRAVRNHLKKVPSSRVTTHDKSGRQEKFELVRFHDQEIVVTLIMKLTATFKMVIMTHEKFITTYEKWTV